MRLSLRFILPLLIVLAIIAYGVTHLIGSFTFRWFIRDLEMRSVLMANTLQETLVPFVVREQDKDVRNLLTRATRDDRLLAIGLCLKDQLLYQTSYFPQEIQCQDFFSSSLSALSFNPSTTHTNSAGRIFKLPSGLVHVTTVPLRSDLGPLGNMLIVHDMSFIEKRSDETNRYIIIFFIVLGIIISTLTVIMAQISLQGWISSIRRLIRGGSIWKSSSHSHLERVSAEIKPVIQDLRFVVKQLRDNQRIRDEGLMSWGPNTLKEILNRELVGEQIISVSNREPYIHHKKANGEIEIQKPASGLVTALEPVMQACSGIWIAHGSGNADQEFVDKHNRLPLPPGQSLYHLRRIWLSAEEEQGHYYGFSNEGLWPLCHIAHTRPIFRKEDWLQYNKVNLKFAEAIVSEAKTDDPVVLVQDYHFALLPKFIRKRLPKATIITFWHIPWPNPEIFGICPWREEILEGLLGSSIIGLHIQLHCNNFIDSVDRFLESRVDFEQSTISYSGELTAVNPYPISIEWPNHKAPNSQVPSIAECRKIIREQHQLSPKVYLGVGVDRLDYTKGILERFLSVERFLQLYPQWVGHFSFIQIAAPSRSSIQTYSRFEGEVRELAHKINHSFPHSPTPPIVLKIEHHNPPQIYKYYRATDLCYVSSLHDGMNLVAKEFVASREDELGSLVLSYFAGASRELVEALIVNPYDIDHCAHTLHYALTMPISEQRERMKNMRSYIQEYNIYRWAGKMLLDAAKVKQRNRLVDRLEKMGLNHKEVFAP